jgi:hypothetical protein
VSSERRCRAPPLLLVRFLFFYIVCSDIHVDDGVYWCGSLSLKARFLVSNCFLFLFYIWVIYVLDLVCMKQICYLNVIVHELAKT